MALIRKLRQALRRRFLRPPLTDWIARAAQALLPSSVMSDPRYFGLWERRGYHVTPVHYYSPIPDLRRLPPETWDRRSELAGLDLNEQGQIELLERFRDRYRREYDLFPSEPSPAETRFFLRNRFFMAVDAEIAYCMVRHFRPARVIEAGSGFSTMLLAQALLANQAENGAAAELVAVEPFPSPTLRAGFPGLSRLIPAQVQNLGVSFFESLGPNDILFIDSSHSLSLAGDVHFLYLEILPRLRPGVIVHVHDIFLPAEYPRDWAEVRRWFFTEQYLLQAFLCFNSAFEVLWASSYMHQRRPDLLRNAFASYDSPDHPLLLPPHSFWMRKTR